MLGRATIRRRRLRRAAVHRRRSRPCPSAGGHRLRVGGAAGLTDSHRSWHRQPAPHRDDRRTGEWRERVPEATGLRSRRRADMTPLRVLESARAVVRIVARAAAVHAYEMGALASTAAMAPLCLVGGGFEPASSVSPHTKTHAAPTARPVLLVHGFGGTKSSWSVIAQALSDRGIMVDTITYRPLGNS